LEAVGETAPALPAPFVHSLLTEAREWLGTPYGHACREKGIAVDCIGLIIGALREIGRLSYDNRSYSPEEDPALLRAELERFCVEVALPVPGDFCLFEIGRVTRHVGIVGVESSGERTLIHCYQSANRVVEHLFDHHWQRRVVAVYRWAGEER